MFTARSTTAFLSRTSTTIQNRFALALQSSTKASISSTTSNAAAATGQAEVILVGCGAPNRGMGWYHAVQMLDKKYVRSELLFPLYFRDSYFPNQCITLTYRVTYNILILFIIFRELQMSISIIRLHY